MNQRLIAKIGLCVAALMLLTGCTASQPTALRLKTVTLSHYAVDVPFRLKFTDTKAEKLVAHLSDDTATSFVNYAVSMYKFPGIVQPEARIDKAYCEQYFQTLAVTVFQDKAINGLRKQDVNLIPAIGPRPAMCDIRFVATNADTESFVAEQFHYQRVLIDGVDEVVVELITKSAQPQVADAVLNSIRFARAATAGQ